MSLRDDIKKLWIESFDDSREYVDMYFDRVYRDADVVATMVSGHPVSSMLLQRYAMSFHGQEMGVSYVAGASTKRQMRGNGLMTELMGKALVESRNRGDMLCALIPANDSLYSYYSRLGFATVFFVDPQRYTSLHTFSPSENAPAFHIVDDIFDERVWLAFDGLQRKHHGMVLHTHRDFLNILDDLRMDSGRFVAMADAGGTVVSMAWGVADNTVADGVVTVKELLGVDEECRRAALRGLRTHFPDRPFKVLANAHGEGRKLYPRGMARIVNVLSCLEAIARNNHDLRLNVRVSDPLIADNNHIYMIANGSVSIEDADRPLELDVDITTLTEIVFSSQEIGDVIGLPSVRPHISLMLD